MRAVLIFAIICWVLAELIIILGYGTIELHLGAWVFAFAAGAAGARLVRS